MGAENIPPVLPRSLPTTINYSLTRWDLLRWQIWVVLRNRVVLAFWFILTGFVLVSELRSPEIAAHSSVFKIAFAIVFSVVMFVILAAIQLIVLVCLSLSRKQRGLLGKHELEIRDDGLLERTDVNESLYRWTGFHKAISSGGYLYLYVTDSNVHVVPKRCFASESEAKQFRDIIERRFKSVQAASIHPRAA
jgi:hypothetical protein